MTEFRKGDVVTVQGIVDFHGTPGVSVEIGDCLGKQVVLVKPEQLTLVRRGFNFGDRVVHCDGQDNIVGKIMAIDNNYAWVKTDDGSGWWTLPISSLRHAPNPSYAQHDPLQFHRNW